MAKFNEAYPNEVLEVVFTNGLKTGLETRTLMKIDRSLTETDGMIKKIRRYAYTGTAEVLAEGEKNTTTGKVSRTPVSYEVETVQHTFKYTDDEFMQDSKVVEMGLKGSQTVMINHFNDNFFAELEKATQEHEYTGAIKYEDVVDALELMELEDENGIVFLISPSLRKALRKDPDFKAVNHGEIILKGHIGYVAGLPIIVSKEVPTDTGYVMTRDAVTLYTKKEVNVDQARDIEARESVVVTNTVAIVALTDDTKIVRVKKSA